MSLEEKKKTESKEKDKALSLVLGQVTRLIRSYMLRIAPEGSFHLFINY
jgi:hypothetical protein